MADSADPATRSQKPPRRVARIVIWTVAGLAVVVVATSGWLYHQVNSKLDSVDLHTELGADRPEPPPEAPPATAVLVLGTDSAAEAATDGPGAVGPAGDDGTGGELPPTGSAMLVHLPDDGGTATAVTLPHDTLVARPDCAGRSERDEVELGAVHASGGPGCVVRAAEELSGIRMDHYLEVDYAGYGPLVDALGGISVTTEAPIQDTRGDRELPPGTHQLTGDEAMAALRAAPPEEQQRFLLALLDKVQEQDLLSSPTTLYRVADAAAGSLTTDTELGSLPELVSFARELSDSGLTDLQMEGVPDEVDAADAFWRTLRTGR